jgi:hypothetical protein
MKKYYISHLGTTLLFTNLCYEGAKNIETYPYVVNKNTTHLKSVAMRPVYLLPSSSPQRNTKRHLVRVSPF